MKSACSSNYVIIMLWPVIITHHRKCWSNDFFFNQAIELDPKRANFFNNRGLAYFRLSPPKYTESLQDFHDAIKLDDNNANIYFNR